MKKVIALTQRVEIIESVGERRDALSQEWTILAQACGFLPLFLPNHLPAVQKLLEEFLADGFLLTGGNDLVSYGGNAPERDELERYLIEISIEKQLPLLGICRGMQMLLDYFGTPLQKVDGHIRQEHSLDNGDTVNSFHAWGAVECRAPLTARAHSDDGVVEKLGHERYSWIHGIMWHPERHHPFRKRDVNFIREVFAL